MFPIPNCIIFAFLTMWTYISAHTPMPDSFTKTPKTYTIHIDQDLEPQYHLMLNDFGIYLKEFLQFIRAYHAESIFRPIAAFASIYQPQKYKDHVAMWSRISNIPASEVLISNLAFEVFCTSIVIRDNNNKIFLGRNLDFQPRDILANLTYIIEARRDNRTVYIGEGLYGGIGMLNGMVPGKFSISINRRKSKQNKFENVLRFFWGYRDPIFYLQEVLEKATSYDEAMEMLTNVKLASPAYFTLAGVGENEGAIITRDYDKVVLVDSLSATTWYLVQTNYDRNLPDPKEDERRFPAENRIREYGDSINYQALFDFVLSKFPSANEETVYTTLQSAEFGYFNSTLYVTKALR